MRYYYFFTAEPSPEIIAGAICVRQSYDKTSWLVKAESEILGETSFTSIAAAETISQNPVVWEPPPPGE